MSTLSVSQSTVTSSDRFMGRVKWFNNKAGYGFITVTDGHKSGTDIFVHHSSIKVDAQQYKYLIQGEYVEFGLSSVSNGDHEYQASDVSGIKGGKLMCETKHELVATRTSYKSHARPETQVQTPVQKASDDAPQTRPKQQAVPTDGYRGSSAGRGSRGQPTGRGQAADRSSGGGRSAPAGRGRGRGRGNPAV